MILQASFVACQIIGPLAAHLGRRSPAALFTVAAIIYTVFAFISLINVRTALRAAQNADPAYGDTFYVVPILGGGIAGASTWALVMALFAAVMWAQTRCGALMYPRVTKVLFWGLHLGLLGASTSVTGLWTATVGPRRYVDYPEFMQALVTVHAWSSGIAQMSVIGLVTLLFVSIVMVWRARRSA
ncbi:MAG: hypothetical protein AAF762_00115 [Pseudomonadota bacterium]